ncbi:hypothetical protein A7D16_20080 [Xanthomonas nasturtii]|nr:hypothetical protein A7D16_20080 [Xanthomonas nasturtii]
MPKFQVPLQQRLSETLPLTLAQLSISKARAAVMLRVRIILRVTIRNAPRQTVITHDTKRERPIAVRTGQLREVVPVQLTIARFCVAAQDRQVLLS